MAVTLAGDDIAIGIDESSGAGVVREAYRASYGKSILGFHSRVLLVRLMVVLLALSATTSSFAGTRPPLTSQSHSTAQPASSNSPSPATSIPAAAIPFPQVAPSAALAPSSVGETKSAMPDGVTAPPHSPDPAIARGALPGVAVPYAGIAVLSSASVDAVGQNQAIHDMENVNPIDTPVVYQTFIFINDTQKPILFDRLDTSTANMSYTAGNIDDLDVVDPGAASALPNGLGPLERLPIKLAVNLVGRPDGPLVARAALFVRGQQLPAAELIVTGQLGPTLAFNKSSLDFGAVAAGALSDLPLTVSIDSRLIGDLGIPKLISSNPAVKVDEGAVVSVVGVRTAPARTWIHYNVTLLPAAPIGPIDGVIAYAPPKGADEKALAWGSASVTLAGSVVASGQPAAQH